MGSRQKLFVYFTAAWFAVMAGVHALVFEPMADGQRAPDSLFAGYGLDTFSGWAGSLDAQERASFLFWHTNVLDRIFPYLLMAALYILLTEALRSFPRYMHQKAWIRTAFPLVIIAPYGLFDVLENALVADMLRGVTEVNAASVSLVSAYTVLKFSSLALAFSAVGVFWLVARGERRSAR